MFNRFLAFSPAPVVSAVIEIDGKPLDSQVTHVKGALYACRWDPEDFSSGIHSITVRVQVRRQTRKFSTYREENLALVVRRVITLSTG